MHTIVVGTDGSDVSVRALVWAYDEAKLRGADLKVLLAWSDLPPMGGPMIAALPRDVLADDAAALLATAVDKLRAERPGNDVHLVALTVEGAPSRALLDAAEDADLLVVGSRGHGGFSSLLLGSVSQQVCHHAACPVVVVR